MKGSARVIESSISKWRCWRPVTTCLWIDQSQLKSSLLHHEARELYPCIPPSEILGFQRVESIKILGVTFSRKFSLTHHVDYLFAACAQSLFTTRMLRQHGAATNALQQLFHATVIAGTNALQQLFHATVIARLLYASPVWWGFANAEDKNRLEVFLSCSVFLGYLVASSPSHKSFCGVAGTTMYSTKSTEIQGTCYTFFCFLHVTLTIYELRVRKHSLFPFAPLLSSKVTS